MIDGAEPRQIDVGRTMAALRVARVAVSVRVPVFRGRGQASTPTREARARSLCEWDPEGDAERPAFAHRTSADG